MKSFSILKRQITGKTAKEMLTMLEDGDLL
jgi:hypothetical protein